MNYNTYLIPKANEFDKTIHYKYQADLRTL